MGKYLHKLYKLYAEKFYPEELKGGKITFDFYPNLGACVVIHGFSGIRSYTYVSYDKLISELWEQIKNEDYATDIVAAKLSGYRRT